MRAQLIGGGRADHGRIADRTRAERMADRVHELPPDALGDGPGVPGVLLDLRNGLLPDELDLLRSERRVHDRVGHEREQGR